MAVAASRADKPIDPVPPQLPEEEFWEKYNNRLEFPLSTVGAVFFHVLVAVGLFVVMVYLVAKPDDRTVVPITFVDAGGDDDFGAGSEGSGGNDDILGIPGEPLHADHVTLPDPRDLPNPEVNPQPSVRLNDPNNPAAVKPASALTGVDSALAKQIGVKNSPGTGKQDGKGGPGVKGSGPGGQGNDATRKRQENWSRWVISFSTFENDGRDYLNQIGTFGATLIVPRPASAGQEPEYLVFDDVLRSPNFRVMPMKEAEKAFAGHVWFSEDPAKYSDVGRKSRSTGTIAQVARALRLDFNPDKFWAVFSKDVDRMLADKETEFLRRVHAETDFKTLSSDDIQTTVFAIDRQSGGKTVEVVRVLLKDERTVIIVQNGRFIVRNR